MARQAKTVNDENVSQENAVSVYDETKLDYAGEQGALVPCNQKQGGLLNTYSRGNKEYWTNLSPDSPKTAILVMKCITGESVKSEQSVNSEIAIHAIFVHMVELCNPVTGEVIALPRTVLIDSKGLTYSFVSTGVYDSIEWITRLFGDGPWIPPIHVHVRQRATGSGNKLLYLDMCTDKPLPKPVPR